MPPLRTPRPFLLAALGLVCAGAGCDRLATVATIGGRNFKTLVTPARPVKNRIERPERGDAGLAALWVGHATVLLQLDDRFVLTDPVFTDRVGQLSGRLVAPGLLPEALPALDAVLISHLHFDHFSLGSLDMMEKKVRRIFLPEGGSVYLPDYGFESNELLTWQSWEQGGLRITAVPVKHVGWRYGADQAWMKRSFTGYVIQYHGITVYYGGDTAYEASLFAEARARFPAIDLAILPIAPLEPRDFMEHTHVDPAHAAQIFQDLGARFMLPIHYDTFVNSFDQPGEAKAELLRVWKERGLPPGALRALEIGEQAVFLPLERGAPLAPRAGASGGGVGAGPPPR